MSTDADPAIAPVIRFSVRILLAVYRKILFLIFRPRGLLGERVTDKV